MYRIEYRGGTYGTRDPASRYRIVNMNGHMQFAIYQCFALILFLISVVLSCFCLEGCLASGIDALTKH